MPTETPPLPEINKTATATKRGKRLLSMKISRDNDATLISLQSDVPWREHLGDKAKQRTPFQLGGVNCFVSRPIRTQNISCVYNRNISFEEDGGYVNSSLLFAEGLERGVVFKFDNHPMSAEKLKEWAHHMRDCTIEIYNLYIKPVDIEMTVNITERATETV